LLLVIMNKCYTHEEGRTVLILGALFSKVQRFHGGYFEEGA